MPPAPGSPDVPASAARKLAAEGLGTGLLVAAVVGSGIMAADLAAGSMAVALLANTVATAAMLYVLVTVLGPVSGAHLNPAVSLAFALRGDLPWGSVVPYLAAQLAGGALGTLLAHAMFELPLFQLATTARAGPAQWLSEGVATFALVLAILGASRARPEAVPACVALVIAAAYWFTASTAFANPAVTVARALSDTFAGIAPAHAPAFILAQLAGAGLALLTAERILGRTPDAPGPAVLAP